MSTTFYCPHCEDLGHRSYLSADPGDKPPFSMRGDGSLSDRVNSDVFYCKVCRQSYTREELEAIYLEKIEEMRVDLHWMENCMLGPLAGDAS